MTTPLDALDPRTRVVTAGVFAVLVVALQAPLALVAALAVAALLVPLAGVPARRVARTVLALDGVVLLTVVTLPFTVPGDAWVTVAGLTASLQGAERALAILLKANATVLALLALVGTLDPMRLGHTLARLGAPDKLVHLYVFTVRYLDVLQDEYRRLRTAMAARGFQARTDRHTWRSMGWLVGMLLVRSVERAERIVAAMRCRGFDGRLRPLDAQSGFRRHDGIFAAASAAGVLVLAVAGRW